MKTLKANDVIRVMREEWSAGVKRLTEKVDLMMNAKVDKEGEIPIISPGTKVKHKHSGLLYTVMSVSPRDVILLPPDSDDEAKFLVNKDEFEKSYHLG